MANPNIAATNSRDLWAAMTRAARIVWFGALSTDCEIPPIAPNNEAIRSVNNAGTAYVDIIKVNASDQVEIPTAFKASGGQASYGGSFPNVWALNMPPVATTTGTSTQGVANQQFVASVWVPVNQTITGIAYLIGTTGGTDKAIVALYDNAGILLANSTTTASGTTVGTAATLQSLAFTTAYAAKGPANYFASVQVSGTTAFVRTIPIGIGACSKTNTATTAAPLATITAPTAFAADAAVICTLY